MEPQDTPIAKPHAHMWASLDPPKVTGIPGWRQLYALDFGPLTVSVSATRWDEIDQAVRAGIEKLA